VGPGEEAFEDAGKGVAAEARGLQQEETVALAVDQRHGCGRRQGREGGAGSVEDAVVERRPVAVRLRCFEEEVVAPVCGLRRATAVVAAEEDAGVAQAGAAIEGWLYYAYSPNWGPQPPHTPAHLMRRPISIPVQKRTSPDKKRGTIGTPVSGLPVACNLISGALARA